MTGHPDNANLPPMTEAERREMRADGPMWDEADGCGACHRLRTDESVDWEELRPEGMRDWEWLCSECEAKHFLCQAENHYVAKEDESDTPNICAECEDTWLDTLACQAADNAQSASAAIQGKENCGGKGWSAP